MSAEWFSSEVVKLDDPLLAITVPEPGDAGPDSADPADADPADADLADADPADADPADADPADADPADADLGDLPMGIDSAAGEWNIAGFLVPTRPERPSVDVMLGRALLRLRLYLGWSQRDLEHASGVDQSTICRLETGHGANVGSQRLVAMLKALRVEDVVFLPRPPAAPPTALELMLRGDPWERAIIEADRRVNRRRSA